MIDTLVLRIHNIRKYRSVLKTLDQFNNKGYTTQTAKVDGKEIQRLRDTGLHNTGEILDILKMNRTGEFLVKTQYAKHAGASSHYTFAWMANHTANFIEFNFSIPKYVYGSNVLMFIDHLGDRDFNFTECQQLQHNFDRAVPRLERFLSEFFKLEFPFTTFDFRDIEVNRIDVCFNQLFRTKQESLKYLGYQKRQKKKYSREDQKGMQDWETSLMYKTQRYSAKVYHKGTEYKKNDLKEHTKINKEKGKQYFKTEQYQAFADRILRYELTIRNMELNYLHKTHIFRKGCPHFKKYFKVYEEVQNAIQKNDRISKKIGELPDEEKAAYKKEHPYIKIDPDHRKVYKWVLNLLNKRTVFRLAVDDEAKQYNKQMVVYDCSDAHFCKKLLALCFEKLVSFIKEYQIKELPEEEKIAKLIDHYNLRHPKGKLPKREMLGYYADLLRLGSFREVQKFNYKSRATHFRFRARFKKIGITDSNLIPLTEDGIPEAELNLRDYHHEHQFNPHFLRKKGFLDII